MVEVPVTNREEVDELTTKEENRRINSILLPPQEAGISSGTTKANPRSTNEGDRTTWTMEVHANARCCPR
tara:strand:+ start:200 stop:409 length:210 start_codon:yes stop_codon:yes gene_type:complete